MSWRCTFVASTQQTLLAALTCAPPKLFRTASENRLTLIFTGQGAQWFAMARELMELPRFKELLMGSDKYLAKLGASWSLYEELMRDKLTSRIDESTVSQPATTAIQLALMDTLHYLGVRPDDVVGHSSGEIAASYAAGALTKDAALMVSYHRGFHADRCKKLQSLSGAMLAVALGEEEVVKYISRVLVGRVVIACNNSPSSTTVSGDKLAIIELQTSLEKSGISARRLKVDTAYHSHHMNSIAEEYEQSLDSLEHGATNPGIRFFSSVTAEEKSSGFGPSYWVQNLVSKVRFGDALRRTRRMTERKTTPDSLCHTFMEIGPHSALMTPTKETVDPTGTDHVRFNYISALQKDCNSHLTFLKSLGNLFEQGYRVDLNAANSLERSKEPHEVLSDLPPYPFDHSISYWHESRLAKDHQFRRHAYHDLLGLRLPGDVSIEPSWRQILSVESLPWLSDHAVDGCIIFPASGFIAMAIEGANQAFRDVFPNIIGTLQRFVLRDVAFLKTLEIPDTDNIELLLTMRYVAVSETQNAEAWREFRIFSITSNDTVTENCRGFIKIDLNPYGENIIWKDSTQGSLWQSAREKLPTYNVQSVYNDMKLKGHNWGPSFACIKDLTVIDLDMFGSAVIPNILNLMPGKYMQPHRIHPATLDALLHTSLMLFSKACGTKIMFPVAIKELTISADLETRPGAELSFATSIEPSAPSTPPSAEFQMVAGRKKPDGEFAVEIQVKNGLLRGTGQGKAASDKQYAETCYKLEWDIDVDLENPSFIVSNAKESDQQETKLASLNSAALKFAKACIAQVSEAEITTQHLEYFNWLRRYCEQENLKEIDKNGLQTQNPVDLQVLGIEGELLDRIGLALPSVLTGHVDSLSLVLEDDLLHRTYAKDTASNQCYKYLVEYLQRLSHKKPGLKMLEIGAGTGGATLPLFHALSEQDQMSIEQYDFTDVSSGFFEQARHMLQQWEDLVRFKTLDIERDPVTQGFSSDYYDVVLASNVLHVSKSVDNALYNATKLLRTGGRLLLIEITRLAPYVNAIFGLLPGWYQGAC